MLAFPETLSHEIKSKLEITQFTIIPKIKVEYFHSPHDNNLFQGFESFCWGLRLNHPSQISAMYVSKHDISS